MERSEYSIKMEQLFELRKRKEELEHKKKMLGLQQTLYKVSSLTNQLSESINEICTSAEIIIRNQDKIEETLVSNKPHIPMSAENARQFCETVHIITDMLSQTNKSADLDGLDNSKYKEFPISANKSIEESKRVLNNCEMLLTNVRNITDDKHFKVISSSNQERRMRRSVVCENSIMNTFLCNNLSASSPINHSRNELNEFLN